MLYIIQGRYSDAGEWTCITAANTVQRAHELVAASAVAHVANDMVVPTFRIITVEVTGVLWEYPDMPR